MDDATRETVSKECFFGKPLPRPLEVLWEAAEAEDEFLTETLSLTLLTSRDVLNDGYGDELLSEGEDIAANVRAHRRLFERLAFFAQSDDGELLAFDLQSGPLDDPPVIKLDTEGEYEWLGINTAEAIYRLSADLEEEDAAREWLEEVDLNFDEPGELGSTTGHLPALGKLQASWYRELLGKPKPRHTTPEKPANPNDALSWFLRPGVEVLATLRQVLGLDDDAYPNEQWLDCDGEGRVDNVWLHPVEQLALHGIRFGTPRADVIAKLGEPSTDWEGKRCRYDVAPAYILYAFEDDVVNSMFIGLDED